LAFPKGRYTKVKASALELDVDQRTRKISERSTGSGSTIGAGTIKTPEEFVAAGIEARGKGDLAKSAWYFMRATEGGSLTGKMYYGQSLVFESVVGGHRADVQDWHYATDGELPKTKRKLSISSGWRVTKR
jgi:hypothetical protein